MCISYFYIAVFKTLNRRKKQKYKKNQNENENRVLGVKRGFSPNSLKCPLVCDTNIVTGLHQDDRTQMLMTDARPSWFCTTSSLPGLKTSGFFVGNCQRNTDEQRERSINILRRITSPELGIDNQKKIIQIRRDSCTNMLSRRILV